MKSMSIEEFDNYHLGPEEFALYDLRVETVHRDTNKSLVCNHPVGSYFELSGENLTIPEDQSFPIYGLAALIAILPAKQRMNHRNDWMETDAYVACPDPNCGGAFRVRRISVTVFGHSEVTVVPLEEMTNE